MKKNTQVTIDLESWADLKARGENISSICDEAVKARAAMFKDQKPQTKEELNKTLKILIAKQAAIKEEMKKYDDQTPRKATDQMKLARELHLKRLQKNQRFNQ